MTADDATQRRQRAWKIARQRGRQRGRLRRQWHHAIAQREAAVARLASIWAEMDALDELEGSLCD